MCASQFSKEIKKNFFRKEFAFVNVLFFFFLLNVQTFKQKCLWKEKKRL